MTATSIGVEFIRINRVQCFDSYQSCLLYTSFTPLENNPVPLGTEVHMVVSLGPATETFSMPSLVGLTQEKAEEDITALGLKVGTVTPVSVSYTHLGHRDRGNIQSACSK